MKIQSLTSLQVLDIEACPELEVLSTEVSKLMINLKYLRLSQCKYIGEKSLHEGSDMSNLEHFEIRNCKLESSPLQSLCQYECLKHLKLYNISSLKYIQDDNSATFSFPSLETIHLYRLPNLKDWCKGLASSSVSCCEKQSLPHLFPRVFCLYILDCPSFNENSIMLTYVTEFFLGNWRYSTFPESYWPSRSLSCALYTDGESLCKTAMFEQYHRGNPLTLVICQKAFETTWRKLDLERVSSRITSLHLENSTILYSPPQGLKHLTALQSLSIVGYNHFLVWEENDIVPWNAVGSTKKDKQSEDGMLWGVLKSLTHLVFRYLFEMKTLPEWVRYIPSLQEIEISSCQNLLLPEWVHINFDYLSLPEKQGFRLVRKSVDDGSHPLHKQQQ